MLTIKNFITRRKKELNINEFDKKNQNENHKVFINILNKYFNEYLPKYNNLNEKTSKQVEIYRKRIDHYSQDIQDYFAINYAQHGMYLSRRIEVILNQDSFLLLRDTKEELDVLMKTITGSLSKDFPYLEIKTKLIRKFVNEYISNQVSLTVYNVSPFPDNIKEWIIHTRNSYGVSLLAFAEKYAEKFSDNEDEWSSSRKTYTDSHKFLEYEYKTPRNTKKFI